MDVLVRFGLRVKEFRTKKGWSQEKLALHADVDRTYIQSIEKGGRNVSLKIIEKISIALDIEIADFFSKNE